MSETQETPSWHERSEHACDAFEKEIKDTFRARVRVAPSINFQSPEYIAKIQSPPTGTGRKLVKFIDLRGEN